ncbi:10294_t:CDS:2, partial [Acaulospora colombiana]
TLISYVMSLPQNLNLYNEILLTNDQVSSGGPDPFKVGLEQSYSDLINAKIGPMKAAIAKNFQEGWKELLKLDQYSTRAYMGLVDPKYPQNTFDSASNLYDCALAETVMDSMDFDWPEGVEDSEKWFYGSSVIASRMAQGLQIRLGQRVTAISPKLNGTTWEAVNVTISGQGTRTYDHVITTLPFGCLRTVDTSQCKFDWELQQAMRTLHYDDSVKVAIQFKSRWWEVEKNQMGGVSSTDRPTRIIVYPSYGIGGNTGASMIVSYTWAQDAMRLGSYRQGRQSVPEKQLIELILKDLSDMHGYPDSSHLQSLIVDWHLQHEGRVDLIRELILKWGLDDEFDMDLLHKQVALGQHQAIRSRREVTK